MSTTVEVSERDDGGYTAVDTTTGAAGEGEPVAEALEQLDDFLRDLEDVGRDDSAEQLRTLSERTKEGFEAEDVTDEDIEDAIDWARSQ